MNRPIDNATSSRRLILGGWIAAGLAALLLLTPSAASARSREVKTKLAFDVFGIVYADGGYDYAYFATVGPALAPLPCASHRTVRVYRKQAHGSDTLVGSDTSDYLGDAVVLRHHPALASVPGTYYAQVESVRKRKQSSRPLHCRGARSRTVTVTEPVFHAAGKSPAP